MKYNIGDKIRVIDGAYVLYMLPELERLYVDSGNCFIISDNYYSGTGKERYRFKGDEQIVRLYHTDWFNFENNFSVVGFKKPKSFKLYNI